MTKTNVMKISKTKIARPLNHVVKNPPVGWSDDRGRAYNSGRPALDRRYRPEATGQISSAMLLDRDRPPRWITLALDLQDGQAAKLLRLNAN